MKWSEEKPTVPGWYWYQPPKPSKVMMIYVREPLAGGVALVAHEFEFTSNTFFHGKGRVPQYSGEWAGPLEPPEER